MLPVGDESDVPGVQMLHHGIGFLISCNMDKLPIEMLLHIMEFMSIKQLHVVMSVNSHWQEVAANAVTNRKVLAIGAIFFADEYHCSELDVIMEVPDDLLPLMWTSIQKVSV